MTQYAMIMALAGIGIPLLAALNAALGTHLGSPTAAALVLFAVAFSCALLAFVLTGADGLNRLSTAPRHLLFGRFLGDATGVRV